MEKIDIKKFNNPYGEIKTDFAILKLAEKINEIIDYLKFTDVHEAMKDFDLIRNSQVEI